MSTVGVDSYVLRMVDQVTGPLRQITAQVDRVAQSMEKLTKLSAMAFAGGAVLGGIKLMSGAIGGLISVMGAGVSIAQRFMGAVLQAAQFRARNITALDTLLGKGQGEGYFKSALAVGGMTPADERDVVEQVRRLAAAGYSGGALNRTNAALLDVQSVMGKENSDALSYYFEKFKGGLSFERDDVRMAAASAGIKERDLLTSALGIAGVKTAGLTDVQLQKQIESSKKAGRLTGETMVEALLQAIKLKLDDGGPLGSMSKKMGMGTLAGLISNIEAGPMRFLSEMKLESLPGIQVFMDFLKRLLVFFDHATPQGKQLAKVVEEITDALFGGFKTFNGDMLERWFRGGVKLAKQLVEVIKQAWHFLGKILDGNWADVVGSGFRLFVVEIGKLIGQGIWEGIWASAPGRMSASPKYNTNVDQQAGASAREGFSQGWKNLDILGTSGKIVSDIGDAAGKVGGDLARPFGDMGGAFVKVGRDLAKGLGFGKTDVRIDTINVGAGVTPEQAKQAAETMKEAIRKGNTRTAGE